MMLYFEYNKQYHSYIFNFHIKITQKQAWFYAAKNNDFKYISQYKNKFQREQNQNGKTALMIAAENQNSLQTIRLLLNSEIQMQTQEGYTALMFAAINNNVKCVKILSQYEQKLYLVTDTTDFPRKTTSLLMAASLGNLDSANIMFKYESQISHFSLAHLSHLNCDLNTIALDEQFQQHSKMVDILGRTPIFYTSMIKYNNQQYEIFRFYIQQYNNNLEFWSKCDIYGFTIFHYLVMNDNVDCIKLLISQINSIVITSIETLYNNSVYTDLSFQKFKPYSDITNKPNVFYFGTKLSLAHIGCCYNSQQFIRYYGNKFYSMITNTGVSNKALSIIYSKNSIQQIFSQEKDDQINISTLRRCDKLQQYQKQQVKEYEQSVLNADIYQSSVKQSKRTAKPMIQQNISQYNINKSDLFRQIPKQQEQSQNQLQQSNYKRESLLLKSLQKQKQYQSDNEDDYKIVDEQNENSQLIKQSNQFDISQDLYNSDVEMSQKQQLQLTIPQVQQQNDIDYQYLQSIVQKSKNPEQQNQKRVIFAEQNNDKQNDKQNLQQAIQNLKQSIYRHNNEQEQQENQQYDQINNKLNEVKQQISKPQQQYQQQQQKQYAQKPILSDQLQILKQQFMAKNDMNKQLKLVRFDDNSTKINNNIAQLESIISNVK